MDDFEEHHKAHRRLCDVLCHKSGALKIALSGGIDSITLMAVAARVRKEPTVAVHAVSAAVPEEATQLCRDLAKKFNWPLAEIDAREFDNEHYIANPVNRCYYCKSSLFDRIIESEGVEICLTDQGYTIATGTNTDDLGDYRPGLLAAQERAVWQPYVEADINKKMIREIARLEQLDDFAQMPAQPCLSSRVETGIAIDTKDLRFIHRVEKLITDLTSAGDIRCRITRSGVTVQLPPANEIFSNTEIRARADQLILQFCADEGRLFTGFEPYKMGSAFLKTSVVAFPDG